MIEKSSAVLVGRLRKSIAGLCGKLSSTNSIHFVVSSLREDLFELLTRTPSGNESLGSARNSGKPPSEAPARNCLPLSLDLNFVTSSSLGSSSKILVVPVLLNRGKETGPLVTGLLRCDEILQQVERTALDMFSVG